MRTTPACVHASRSVCSHCLYASLSPARRTFETSVRSDGGAWLGWKDCSGLTSTAAISEPRARMTCSERASMSRSVSVSSTERSLPAAVCTPSHQPWYAPPKRTISFLRVLNRATRAADMTASVPLMWNETSGLPETRCSARMFSSVSGEMGPSTQPSELAARAPSCRKALYRSCPHTLTPYEPAASRSRWPSKSMIAGPSVVCATVAGSKASARTLLKGG
mmetsp:Transcript_9003/g.28298  ORF Transcript_9003/g.28298 Transcript_9003/m.28298 type:complete len:221 (-) Transcript_9003:2493-3155(-)